MWPCAPFSSLCKESPSADEQHSETSSGLCCSRTLAPAFPHRKRSLLPSTTVCSSQHKLAGYEKPTTGSCEPSLSGDLQMGHVRARMWSRLNTTNNLLWNKEPQSLVTNMWNTPTQHSQGKIGLRPCDCSKSTPPHMGLRPLHMSFGLFSPVDLCSPVLPVHHHPSFRTQCPFIFLGFHSIRHFFTPSSCLPQH